MKSPFKDKMGNKLSWIDAIKKIANRFYNYYLDLKVSLLWLLGYIPLHFIRRFIFKLSGVKIDKKSTIHIGLRMYQPKNISIGKGTIIGDHATLDGRDKLVIGNNVDIASEVMIFNSQHNIHDESFSPINGPVEIKDYVFIGPRAIILPGVTISRGAVVAAGAVVTKDVSEKSIVAGIPAKEVGKRKVENFKYKLGRFRLFQ
ncbi:acyltransferase [Patescibacteria group bacterium]